MANKYIFSLVKETFDLPEVGEYDSYGITVLDEKGVQITKISDISTDLNEIKNLIDLCNENEVDLVHLDEIVENFLIGC